MSKNLGGQAGGPLLAASLKETKNLRTLNIASMSLKIRGKKRGKDKERKKE